MSSTSKNVLTLVAALLIIAVFAVVIVVVRQQQEQQKFINTFGEDVANMCNPPEGGAASDRNWPRIPGSQMQILLLEQGATQKHGWHDDLPDDLRADSLEEVDLVICMGEEGEIVLETCEYTQTGDPRQPVLFRVQLVRPTVNIIILNRQTGQRIVEIPVGGSTPPQCPQRDRVERGTTKLQVGDPIDAAGFARAIDFYLSRR